MRDVTGNSEYYKASDYGAVVYIAEFWMWHTPRHAIGYYNRNGKVRNIVFVVTSGDPKVKMQKPFDAITSASKPKEVDRVSSEIMARQEGIIR